MNLSGKKILIQRADRLGDVILSLPVVEAIKEKYPTAQIHFLTSPIGAALLETHPMIDKVISLSDLEFGSLKSTIRRIRFEGYALYISLWNHPKMAYLGVRSRIPNRIGDTTHFIRGLFYNKGVRQDWEDYSRHQIEFNLDLLQPLQIPSTLKRAEIPIAQAAKDNVRVLFHKFINPEKEVLVLFTGTGGTNYPIPSTVVAEFVGQIQSGNDYAVVLCGQTQEGDSLTHVSGPDCLNLLNKTTFQELVAIIAACDYYIGPDTGPTHLASFLNKPIVFFSSMKPNPPNRWGVISDYFQILRREYDWYHHPIESCDPSVAFQFLTAQLLKERFYELVQEKAVGECLLPEDVKTRHFYHSFRVMAIAMTDKEHVKNVKIASLLQTQGLRVFPVLCECVSWKSLKVLFRLMNKYNINVIQGRVFPVGLSQLLRFYMGAVCAYIRPIVVKQDLGASSSAMDWLDVYRKGFQRSKRYLQLS